MEKLESIQIRISAINTVPTRLGEQTKAPGTHNILQLIQIAMVTDTGH